MRYWCSHRWAGLSAVTQVVCVFIINQVVFITGAIRCLSWTTSSQIVPHFTHADVMTHDCPVSWKSSVSCLGFFFFFFFFFAYASISGFTIMTFLNREGHAAHFFLRADTGYCKSRRLVPKSIFCYFILPLHDICLINLVTSHLIVSVSTVYCY